MSSPVSSLRIALRISAGNSLDAACCAVNIGVWRCDRCRIDSWVMVCIRLRVLYAGDVCGGTLGDGVAAVCGGSAITLGAAGAGG